MSKVGIVGVGMTKFGEQWNHGFRELVLEAGVKAINDAKIEGKEIQAIYGGTMSSGFLIGQEHISVLIADQVGLIGIPTIRVEAACASGGLALRQAYLAIKSGRLDVVAAGGVEKMTDVPSNIATVALMGAGDEEWEGFYGATFPALYALMARRHMLEYGTTEEQMAMVAVKNHHNGTMNPNAQYQKEITVEDVMNSTPVAEPLKLLDCSPITDGAAVVILASEEKAKKISKESGKEIIWIEGSGQASDTLALHDRDAFSKTKAAILAGKMAYEQANVKPTDIDFAEVHDCFTIAEIMALEALGFCGFGEGGKITENNETALNGRIPINPSGGLKAKGHPIGATGIAQAIEATLQLRGEAGKRQIKNAECGLTHNVGGTGATCVVHIFKKN